MIVTPVEYLEKSFMDNEQMPNEYLSDDSDTWPVEWLDDTLMEIDQNSDVRSIEFVEEFLNEINDWRTDSIEDPLLVMKIPLKSH